MIAPKKVKFITSAVIWLCLFVQILTPLRVQAVTLTPAAQTEINKTKIAEQNQQATLLRSHWKLAQAESLWQQVISQDPQNITAWLGLADIARQRLNYPTALNYLKNASRVVTDDPAEQASLQVAYGWLALTLEETDSAQKYFEQALAITPNYTSAFLGEAWVALLKRDYKRAEQILQQVQALSPERADLYVGLARVYLEEDQNEQAAAAAQRALDIDKYSVEAMAALCSVYVADKKPELVRKLAKAALTLNPYNNGVRRLLSQYLNSKKAYQYRVTYEVQTLINQGDNLKEQNKYEGAASYYRQALAIEPKAIRAWLGVGACEMAERNFLSVVYLAEQALVLDSENALAHLQLSLAYSGIHEQARLQAGATDWRIRYEAQTPLTLEGIADIFIHYNSLTDIEKQVIEHSVCPLAAYLKELKNRGGKHHLLAIDHRLSDVSGYEILDNRTTIDGRYYASVRGVGGLVTVSGVEYLDVALRGGFNTIAHEFAHQIHTAVLPPDVVDQIKHLYQQAVVEGRVLDYYAAFNEWEYFAQGYEAYVSDFKRPNAGVTARHTKQELRQQDPALYALIERLAHKPTPELTQPANTEINK